MNRKLHAYALLLRLNRPIGTLLVLWPTLWALLIAGDGRPEIWTVTVFVIGAFLMRSAGCAINDFADRKVDGYVERTRQRPLATGEISAKEAVTLFALLSLISFALVLTLNKLTIALSLAGLLLAFIYPFMKRVTHLPQLVLGIAFSWGIPMAFAAQQNSVPMIAWWLMLANICWTIAYDTLYAMVDRNDDIKVGIKSTAILFGSWDKAIVGLLQLATLIVLGYCGQQLQLTLWYWLGLGCCALLFSYQQWLVRHRERGACFKAFLHNNYAGMVIFIGLFASYYL